MTIQQSPAPLSLLGNMLHLVVSSDADVTMTLSLGNERLVAHTYSPDSAGLIDVDLGDIVAAHLSFTLQDAQAPYRQNGIIRQFSGILTCGEQAENFGFTVIRAGVDKLADTPSNFLSQNFLTWQPTVKPVTYYTPEFLTYYAQQPCTVKCTAYTASGTGTTLVLGSLLAGGCYTIPTGYAVIAGLADSLPSYYDVWVEDQSGTRLTYIQRYYASDIRSEEEEWILFENSLGGIDTFRAYGDSENTAEHEHHVAEMDDESVEYRVDVERKHKKSTGLLDKYERRWLLDFFPSKGKYIYAGASIRRIVVTESDVNYNAKELPSEYHFTYKFAEAKPYLNLPRTDATLQEMHIDVPDVGSFTIAPRLVEFPRQSLSGGALFPIQNPYSESWGVTTLAAIAQYLLGDTSFTEGLLQQGLSENDVQEIIRAFTNGRFLSKVNDDTAAGEITFQKGLKSLMQAKFGNYLRGGTGKSGAAITSDGLGDFLNIVFTKVLKGYGARSGFTDGSGIYMDARQGLIETDGLEVRGFMRIMELVINRLQLMESDFSFTEGGEIEHVDYTNDGRLLLRMHKRHDADYTPFYQGDILYAEINDLLPRDAPVPDGHTVTENGSHYTVWMMVDEVDFSENTLTVSLYPARENGGDPIVPGGMNFTLYGTPITGSDHPSVALTMEKAIVVDGNALGETGYDCSITVTRHGNVANSADTAIRERQMERQQSWVLSTTDKRLSFFWHVDQPIIRDDNYALCLGILPDLANLPVTRDPQMPSLYINTIFYENIHHIYYPSRIIKEERGEWTQNPQVEYTGPSGTYTPDGTLSASEQQRLGAGGSFTQGQMISEPYHYQEVTRNTWLTCRLSPAWVRLSDSDLLGKIKVEWHLDLETSRVRNYNALWECREEGTAEEPWLTSTKWAPVSTPTISLGFFSADDLPLTQLGIHEGVAVNETIIPKLCFGQYDASASVRRWQWERESAYTDLDLAWNSDARTRLPALTITDDDLPSGWENAPLSFKCTAWFGTGDGEEQEITNVIQLF